MVVVEDVVDVVSVVVVSWPQWVVVVWSGGGSAVVVEPHSLLFS